MNTNLDLMKHIKKGLNHVLKYNLRAEKNKNTSKQTSQTYTEPAHRKTQINCIDEINDEYIQPSKSSTMQPTQKKTNRPFIYDTNNTKMFTNELDISMLQGKQ